MIEVLLRARNQTGAPVAQFRKDIDGAAKSASRLTTALKGVGAAVGVFGLLQVGRAAVNAADGITLLQSKLRLVTKDESDLARVQQQIVDLAKNTRTELDSVGELYARVARSTKQLGASQADVLTVTKAVSQAVQISGNTAVEASAGMIQLAQALASGVLRGDELRSVLEQMPRVAQAIADGMGTTIGQLRALGAAGKLTSEEVFQALVSQAGKLNSEFSKLSPTVGQSLTVLTNELKLATAEALKSTGITGGLTTAIQALASALRGLTSLAKSVRGFFSTLRDGLSRTADDFADNFPRIERTLRRIRDAFLASNPLTLPLLVSEHAEIANQFTRGGGPRRGGPRGDSRPKVPPIDVREFNVALQKIELGPYQQVLADMEQLTKTSTEKQLEDFQRIKETLKFLLDQGRITTEQFNARLGEAQDELLPEFDLTKIRELYLPVVQQTNQTAEIMKGIWQGVGQSMQRTLSDAIYEMKLSLRSLVDIARRAVADILSALLSAQLKQAFTSLLSGTGKTPSGSSAVSAVIDTGFAVFGAPAAGGGNFDGPKIVGEDGPEIVTGRGRVFNKRQLAFAGAGAGFTFAPVTNISIIERENPDQTRREIFQTVAIENAKQQREFLRLLGRSGVEVKG